MKRIMRLYTYFTYMRIYTFNYLFLLACAKDIIWSREIKCDHNEDDDKYDNINDDDDDDDDNDNGNTDGRVVRHMRLWRDL